MKDSSLIVTLGVLAIAFAFTSSFKSKENYFGGLNRTWKVQRVMKNPGSDHVYTVPGQYQALISPRFSNVNYGAYIRYNLPGQDQMATPLNPIQNYGNVEQRCAGVGAGIANCSAVGTNLQMNPKTNLEMYSCGAKPVEEMYTPVGSAGSCGDGNVTSCVGVAPSTGEIDPNMDQPIIYDRFMFANQQSRLFGLGDPIRGDIPIAPISSDWFRPSVQPQIDLREGSLSVMGGAFNQTQRALANLQSYGGGGINPNPQVALNVAQATQAGSPVQMNAMKSIGLSDGRSTVSVTAFP